MISQCSSRAVTNTDRCPRHSLVGRGKLARYSAPSINSTKDDLYPNDAKEQLVVCRKLLFLWCHTYPPPPPLSLCVVWCSSHRCSKGGLGRPGDTWPRCSGRRLAARPYRSSAMAPCFKLLDRIGSQFFPKRIFDASYEYSSSKEKPSVSYFWLAVRNFLGYGYDKG